MKGVKSMSLATGTAKRFQADDIFVERIYGPEGLDVIQKLKLLLEENKKLKEELKNLNLNVKEIKDKVDSFEVE